MVISLLSKLLDEHNLSVLKLSKSINISRPTLTALINNTSKGIQFDTLDKLCRFFNVPINKILLLFDVTDCSVSVPDLTSDVLPVDKHVYSAIIKISDYELSALCTISSNGNDITVEVEPRTRFISEDTEYLLNVLNTVGIKQQLIEHLENEFYKYIENSFDKVLPDNYSINVSIFL